MILITIAFFVKAFDEEKPLLTRLFYINALPASYYLNSRNN